MILVCTLQRFLKSVLLFTTILSIVDKFKGVQCNCDIIEYGMINVPQKIEIFNEQCLLTLFNYIDIELKKPKQDDLRYLDEYFTSALRVIGEKTHRIYQEDIWILYKEINNIQLRQFENKQNELKTNANNLIRKFYEKSQRTWITRKEKEIYMEYKPKNKTRLSEMKNFLKSLSQQYSGGGASSQSITKAAYTFCKKTFIDLANQSPEFQYAFVNSTQSYFNDCPKKLPDIINFGYILYLMKDDEIYEFSRIRMEPQKYKYLNYIMREAIIDVFRGVIRLLSDINTSNISVTDLKKDAAVENINVQILKMLRIMYYSIIDVAEKIFILSYVNDEQIKYFKVPSTVYNYKNFKVQFQRQWHEIVVKIQQDSRSTKGKGKYLHQIYQSVNFEKSNDDYTCSYEDIFPSVRKSANESITEIETGRLIKNNYVTPSLLRYFSVFNKSWRDREILDTSNTDYKILLALDLNAWTSLMNSYCYKMLYSLSITLELQYGNIEYDEANNELQTIFINYVLENYSPKIQFDKDREFMNEFNDLFS